MNFSFFMFFLFKTQDTNSLHRSLGCPCFLQCVQGPSAHWGKARWWEPCNPCVILKNWNWPPCSPPVNVNYMIAWGYNFGQTLMKYFFSHEKSHCLNLKVSILRNLKNKLKKLRLYWLKFLEKKFLQGFKQSLLWYFKMYKGEKIRGIWNIAMFLSWGVYQKCGGGPEISPLNLFHYIVLTLTLLNNIFKQDNELLWSLGWCHLSWSV